MPSTGDQQKTKSLTTLVEEVGVYPVEAFEFVQAGLGYTVQKIHAAILDDPSASKHVSGSQLAAGLLEFAQLRWGLMARVVLAKWNINSTLDFGRIVFSMIESGMMSKTAEDTVEDFRNVFDFKTAFGKDYPIGDGA